MSIRATFQKSAGVLAAIAEINLHSLALPLEDLVQGAVDQTLTEIKHRPGCHLCLLRLTPDFRQILVLDPNGVKSQLDVAANRKCSDSARVNLRFLMASSSAKDRFWRVSYGLFCVFFKLCSRRLIRRPQGSRKLMNTHRLGEIKYTSDARFVFILIN